jgi:MraZ protein
MMTSELKRLEGLDPLFSGAYNDLAAPLVSGASSLPIDENGRVRLPDELIEAAGFKDRVVFVGVGAKFEIWNPETYAPVKAQRLANAKAERAAHIARENAARAAMQAAAVAVPAEPSAEGTP